MPLPVVTHTHTHIRMLAMIDKHLSGYKQTQSAGADKLGTSLTSPLLSPYFLNTTRQHQAPKKSPQAQKC